MDRSIRYIPLFLGGCPLRSNGPATGIESSVGCSGCVARFFDGDRGLEDAGGTSEGTASGGYSFLGPLLREPQYRRGRILGYWSLLVLRA